MASLQSKELNMLPEPYASNVTRLLALCIWREARGESIEAKHGVASVIRNRCAIAPAEGFSKTIEGNIFKPYAFSSFNPGDPNSTKFPLPNDSSWLDSLHVAQSNEPDTTCGAVWYFSRPLTAPPKQWGKVEHSATIGGFQFYRIADGRR
jgi:spore germination cell wall hydrolase CwlJ-like protein